MKIIFAGTPSFAATILETLLNSQHEVVGVLTQPDKPAGRGQKASSSEVKQLSQHYSFPILQPTTLKDENTQLQLKSLNADLMVVAVYGLLLPKAVLTIPKLGCLNVHASLLPRWRGASPIQQALIAGDSHTGITLMKMDEGLDTGNILLQSPLSIEGHHTSTCLFDELASIGASSLIYYLDYLESIRAERLEGWPQEEHLSCHAPKIQKKEGQIDWHQPATHIERIIRAYQPWPICYSELNHSLIRLWRAEVINKHDCVAPGTIVDANASGLIIQTGQGCIKVTELQLPGKKRMPYHAIHQGYTQLFKPGSQFNPNK